MASEGGHQAAGGRAPLPKEPLPLPNVQSPRRVALFDLDRTLVRGDTASLYVQYRRDIGAAGIREATRVAGWLLQYTLGVIDAERVAEKALLEYRGQEEAWMIATCDDWYRRYIRRMVSPVARATVAHHQAQGDLVAIVTGATVYVAAPLGRDLGIEHRLCTELELDASGTLFTGKVVKPMCYAEGKVVRTRAFLDVHGLDFQDAVFYSDSITDRPLLEAVGRAVVVNPDRRLSRLARKLGWPIERW